MSAATAPLRPRTEAPAFVPEAADADGSPAPPPPAS
eukprot:CAMPEP_0194283678 /NCGR_PEP_ID=MMETSP0169-20130528/25934_1 /TAXON_ID=218684 /ORGANISM="Corethron pennatum, Strain L29A3" /LENGTH=35 /DNA_ID= /DNA_START= /DNA_END= /DNA_ORIENTATION=